MGGSEVLSSVVNWSEGEWSGAKPLRKRLPIITKRYTDHMKCCCFFHIVLVQLCIIVYFVVCLYAYISFCILCILIVMYVPI